MTERLVEVPEIIRIKVMTMGNGGTGKSCIIKRYCEERFVSKYIPTIGIDFGVKSVDVNGYEVRVNFWDMSGHPEYFDVRNEFYSECQGAVLVFDVTSKRSFDDLSVWLSEATKYGCSLKDIVVAVVGNQIDKSKRAVNEAEARTWATGNGFLYFETSANTGENVNEMFDALFSKMLKKILPS